MKRRMLWPIGVLLGAALIFIGVGTRQEQNGLVHIRHVVDGDTVETQRGSRIRYIGIDTPETRHKSAGVWVYDPEPFAGEAARLNRRLVEGRKVRLEHDVESQDKYGRQLAYVFLEDGTFVNLVLVREGLARVLMIPPNTRYAEEFGQAEARARMQRKGIWGIKGRP